MVDQIKKVKLLLVDDEEEFIRTTSKVLSRRGIEVFTASRGTEALEILGQQEVDVVVLDMKMPGMDGAAVFDEIKKVRFDLPVIILTGHESLSEACQLTKEGVFDYLLKPCDSDVLAERVHDAAARNPIKKEAAQGDRKQAENDVETVRVLLVDDERLLLETLKKVLSRRAMEVITADSGEKALELLNNTSIDVIVLDIKMPGMNGLDVLSKIKSGFVNREVILLTGHPTVETAMTGMKQGAFEYMLKPPDVDKLTESIRKAYRLRMEKIASEREETINKILRRYPD